MTTTTAAPPAGTRVAAGARTGAGALVVVTLLGLSAFGPYLGSGIRTDQVVVYGLVPLVLPFTWLRIRLNVASAALLAAWLMFAAVAVIMWATGGAAADSAWGSGSPLASADNLLLPVAAFLLTLSVLTEADGGRLLQRLCAVVTAGMSVNAVLAVSQYALPAAVPSLSRFWGSGDTAERAATLGRFTGIVSQPSVAGLLYSMALVCAIYALRNRVAWRGVVVVVLTVGGVLTLSKGFLLIGVPIAAWQLLRLSGTAGRRLALALGGLAGVAAVEALGWFGTWQGIDRLVYLLPGGDATWSDYLGNRYAQSSPATRIGAEVLDRSPLGGYGLAGVGVATDSALVHALVLGGLLGVAFVALATFTPLVSFLRGRRGLPQAERMLFGGVALVVVLGSVGSPLLVANRMSVLVWALLAILLTRPRSSTPR